MEIDKCCYIVDANIVQNPTLNCINPADKHTGCVIYGRGSVFNEAEQVSLIQNNQVSMCIKPPRANESADTSSSIASPMHNEVSKVTLNILI